MSRDEAGDKNSDGGANPTTGWRHFDHNIGHRKHETLPVHRHSKQLDEPVGHFSGAGLQQRNQTV